MKKIEVSMQEIYEAMRGNVHRNRRKYYRKEKHKKKRFKDYEDYRYNHNSDWARTAAIYIVTCRSN
jgi:hypothetical protein